jgi:hypothetical protein
MGRGIGIGDTVATQQLHWFFLAFQKLLLRSFRSHLFSFRSIPLFGILL